MALFLSEKSSVPIGRLHLLSIYYAINTTDTLQGRINECARVAGKVEAHFCWTLKITAILNLNYMKMSVNRWRHEKEGDTRAKCTHKPSLLILFSARK
jgi:hypothetical protein